jgi:F0F1-type ATP synthase assembly protein I
MRVAGGVDLSIRGADCQTGRCDENARNSIAGLFLTGGWGPTNLLAPFAKAVLRPGRPTGSFKKARSAMADQPTPESRDESGRKADADSNAWIGLSGVGIEFILSVLLPGAGGWWLDRKFGTMPWLMLVGGLFGCVAGFYSLLRTIKGKR